jgi:hypothetical protein
MCLILAQHLVSKILINIQDIQQLADRDNLGTQDYAIILGQSCNRSGPAGFYRFHANS